MIDAERFPRLAARLRLKVPSEKVAQIHEFAKDLAVGFDEGAWSEYFRQHNDHVIEHYSNENYKQFFEKKWAGVTLYAQIMVSMGYLQHMVGHSYISNVLTERALRLVDEPVTPPNVFISYKRSESSAFALLLEARIKYETNSRPFLDKNIELGDDWHARLEEKVKASRAFICVIAPNTLDPRDDGSKFYVLREIEWALDSENTDIIPVWHHGYEGVHDYDIIAGKQAEPIESENAKNYDAAVNQVLNRLGFSPHFIAQRQNV